jgi:hypothetical protein
MKDNEFLVRTPDGRTWRAEVFGPGQRFKVTDIMSPTGYFELVDPSAVGVTFMRDNHQKQKSPPRASGEG